MEENNKNEVLQINSKILQKMSLENLVDLKIELDDMTRTVDELIAQCDELLKEEAQNT